MQNYGDIKRPVVPMSKEGGRDKQTENTGFLGQWKYSYDNIMVDTCNYVSQNPRTSLL